MADNTKRINKVLLIQPPLHPDVMILGTMEPLGLELVAAGLQPSHEVRILDMRVDHSNLTKTLEHYRPDLVGVTGISVDFSMMVEVLKVVKRHRDNIITVVGGHHASVCPNDFCIPVVDFIQRGQGVYTLPALITRLNAKATYDDIAGLCYRKEDSFVVSPQQAQIEDMTTLPLPARRLTRNYRKRYSFSGSTHGLVTTSQGCPNRCNFCACWKIVNGRYQSKSPEQVVAELREIPERHVFIGDDHTFGNVKRATALYECIKQSQIKKEFEAYSRADTIVKYPELFRKWASVGLKGLTVGFEGTSDEELSQYNKGKGASAAINKKANQILMELGIINYAHMIVRPDFKTDDFMRFAQYILDLGIIHPVHPVLTPLPGTDLYANTPGLEHATYAHFDLSHPVTPLTLSKQQFYHELKWLYFQNYSYTRWFKALIHRARTRFGNTYSITDPRNASPDLLSITVMRWFLNKQFTSHKIKRFTPARQPTTMAHNMLERSA